jgi:hypothetical protein
MPDFTDSSTLEFLDKYEITKDNIKQYFISSKCYNWLKNLLLSSENNESYFGMLSKKLHEALISDPKPYRQEVKEILSNLLGWIAYLNIEEIGIDRPNHSQRVKLKVDN